MGITTKDKKALENYKMLCDNIRQSTGLIRTETGKEQDQRIRKLLSNYGDFFEYYFPHYAKAACAPFQVREAHKVKADPFYKGAWEWFRGSAKSTHADIGVPLWLKQENELNFFVQLGENENKACILLSALQAELESNERIIADFGQQISYGSWADGAFETTDNRYFHALGLGQSPRGLRHKADRPDYIVVDDADTKKRCKNPRLVREATEYILEDLMGCFGGDRERFLIVNNRIHKNSILVNIIDSLEGIRHSKVNALDKSFNPTWPARYSKEYWDKKQSGLPFRSFQREYMNNPIEEGTIFRHEWIRWEKLPKLQKYDYLVAYCDPSFKNTRNSDFKAIKLWGKIGKELHLIKPFVRQTSVAAMVKWFYDLHESVPEDVTVDYYIEANMLQDLFLDEFTAEGVKRGYQLPIRGDKRAKPDKFARVEATSPLYERGLVVYNEELKDDPDMKTAVDQLLSFEKGSNAPDDSPDADEGAIFLLEKKGRAASFDPVIGMRERTRNVY